MSDLDDFLAAFPFATNTCERYTRALNLLFSAHPDPASLTSGQLRTWLGAHGWGSSATWVAYCAVRKFLAWRYGAGHPALKLKLKRQASSPQRSLNVSQVQDLMSHFNTMTPTGIRDCALAALMLDTGLRCSEVCNLELRRLDQDRKRLSVVVKGGAWGDAIYSDYTAAYLADWLAIRDTYAASSCRTVFCSVAGETPGQPLTRDGLGTLVARWGERAGIGKLSPHDLRRTFATLSTRRGAPERILQVAGRWKDSDMIRTYTRDIAQEDFRPYLPMLSVMDHQKQPKG